MEFSKPVRSITKALGQKSSSVFFALIILPCLSSLISLRAARAEALSTNVNAEISLGIGYERAGNHKLAEQTFTHVLEEANHRLLILPAADLSPKNNIVLAASCLSLVYFNEGQIAKARNIFDKAQNVASQIPSGHDDGLAIFLPAISADIELKAGHKKRAKELYLEADQNFSDRIRKSHYDYFSTSACPACKLFFPCEQSVLRNLISVLNSLHETKEADAKRLELENLGKDEQENLNEERLRKCVNKFLNHGLGGIIFDHDIHVLLKQISDSDCNSDFKIDELQLVAKDSIKISRFAEAIEIIDAALNTLSGVKDAAARTRYLQQLRIRAEVTAGEFEKAQKDCSQFFASAEVDDKRLRNNRLDVQGWQARKLLLTDQTKEARDKLEQVIKDWDKDGANTLAYREHLLDLCAAYFEFGEFEKAARALRFYLDERPIHTDPERYLAECLLARTYQKMGFPSLGSSIVKQVRSGTSGFDKSFDDIEKIQAMIYLADFYFDAGDKSQAVAFYQRGKSALEVLGLSNLPIACHIQERIAVLPVHDVSETTRLSPADYSKL